MVLHERARIFSITESDSKTDFKVSAFRPERSPLTRRDLVPPEVKNDSEDEGAHNGKDFNRTTRRYNYWRGSISRMAPVPRVHSRENRFGLSIDT